MHPRELKTAFEAGENISSILKQAHSSTVNTQEIIETAYDLQAGSYIRSLDDPAVLDYKVEYGQRIADAIRSFTDPSSIIETGIGEGTTFSFVLEALDDPAIDAHGFDISWSRIAWCQRWLTSQFYRQHSLAVASLLRTPYADSCFDVVYTSHTVEPNGGNETTVLQELYRITSRYLVLLEPGYELASDEAKQRMDRLGYCKGLPNTARSLGMNVVKHELLGMCINPLNPTAITVIEKNALADAAKPKLVCPVFHEDLDNYAEVLFSPESLRAYPKILGIPCLRPEDAVIASALPSFSPANYRPSNVMTGPQI